MADPKKPEVSTVIPKTREEFEKALAERRALTTMLVPGKEPAGQAKPGAPPVTYAEAPRPAVPPAPQIDREKVVSARDARLAEVDAKVEEMRRLEVELETQQKNAEELVKQMKSERQAILVQKEELERSVIRIQQDLARQEALDLLGQQETAQARANGRVPGEQAAREVKALLEPLIWKTALGAAKLKEILATHGSALERISKLRARDGYTNEDDRVSYINTTTLAGTILDELHAAINQHERALQKASALTSRASLDVDPRGTYGSEPDHTLVCEVQLVLEQVSGMVQAQRFGSSIKVPTSKDYNESPTTHVVDGFRERITSFLAQFAEVARRAPRPTLEITILPKEKPRHQVMAELRGPKPESTHAEGVPEGVK